MPTAEELLLSTVTPRSEEFEKIKRRFLRMNPHCAVCGTTKKKAAHHIRPVYLWPELALDETNLITLCKRHHLEWGHLGSYKSYNLSVVTDAEIMKERIKTRPKWGQKDAIL